MVETFEKAGIGGEMGVCRECLVDGEASAGDLDEFWQIRESYLKAAYPKPEGFYREKVRAEFEKLLNLPAGAEVNLWFEYELFCQVNLWFCLWLLSGRNVEVYRVAPVIKNREEIWKGFGVLDQEDLKKSFDRRIKFGPGDIRLGADLWRAFCSGDREGLETLGANESECFPHLEEVCRAAVELKDRPRNALRKIMAAGEREFGPVFRVFNQTEGIYGFGDLQVKRIYEELL